MMDHVAKLQELETPPLTFPEYLLRSSLEVYIFYSCVSFLEYIKPTRVSQTQRKQASLSVG